MNHSEDQCPVCSEVIEIFAIGSCDHKLCHKCAIRIRVLCDEKEEKYCPICRTEMPIVILTRDPARFDDINTNRFLDNKKYQLLFEDSSVRYKFQRLLEHNCPMCRDRPPDRIFENLNRHMRRDHEMHYCDICVKHLKIFTHERKYYNRKDLATHRREGDKDDKSYKGHPICRFCDIRFLDKDLLANHLRRDHFYCHFCEADGSNEFYSDYPVLREHFGEAHYLCLEDECRVARFTHAFRTDIDIQVHQSTVHGKNVHKSNARQTRTLDVEFPLTQRPNPRDRGHRNGNTDDRNSYQRRRHDREDRDMSHAIEASLQITPQSTENKNKPRSKNPEPDPQQKIPLKTEDNFPTLGGDAPPSYTATGNNQDSQVTSTAQKVALAHGFTVGPYTPDLNSFPSLHESESSSGYDSPVNYGNSNNYQKSTSNAMHTNYAPQSTYSTRAQSSEEYPELGGSRVKQAQTKPPVVTGAWASKTAGKPKSGTGNVVGVKNYANAGHIIGAVKNNKKSDFSPVFIGASEQAVTRKSEKDFPSLGSGAKTIPGAVTVTGNTGNFWPKKKKVPTATLR